MKTIKEIGAWRGFNRYGRDFKNLDIHRQVTVLLDELGDVHLHRKKTLAHKTVAARHYVIRQFITGVREAGFVIHNILNLDQRHVGAGIKCWVDGGLAASTIQTRMSIIRWLACAIGKRGLVMDPSYYGVADDVVARTYVARVDKSWSAKQVISKEKVAEAMEIDPWVGHQLNLMRAFGLRLNEAVMLRPHIADQGTVLRVEEGTKGGRTRNVAIRTADQRETLDGAKALAIRHQRGSMCQPSLKIEQARRRLYYVAGEKLGLCKSALGVTPHGLRHEFANDLYEEVSGAPSAVRGGTTILDRAADEAARHQITQELGHARLSITAAYTGPRIQGRPRGPTVQQVAPPPDPPFDGE